MLCSMIDASQDEKGEKCRKGALTGDMGLNPVSLSYKKVRILYFIFYVQYGKV